jgi:colanic acid/amylovoran biosynthesis glycosyltransferase
MEKMQLLIVGIKWPAETFLWRKIEGLAKAGLQIYIATTSRIDNVEGYPNIAFIHLPSASDSKRSLLLTLVSALFEVLFKPQLRNHLAYLWQSSSGQGFKERVLHLLKSSALASLRPDIVHYEWNTAAMDFQYMQKIWQCPNIVSCRGSQILIRPHLDGNAAYLEALKTSFSLADGIHCVSQDLLQEGAQYGLDAKKARVIRPAVNEKQFYPLSQERNDARFHVVSTGSLLWVKGFEHALAAIALLKAKGVPLTYHIIGDGPELLRILYTINDLGLQEDVKIHGKLKPEQVLERLQSSDVFLLSSLGEGISNAVLEAMSCGLPVVSTDCGGMSEVIQDGQEGYVVPIFDAEAMAERLFTLYSDKALRQNMGKQARQKILNDYRLEQQIQHFLDFYGSLLQPQTSKLLAEKSLE